MLGEHGVRACAMLGFVLLAQACSEQAPVDAVPRVAALPAELTLELEHSDRVQVIVNFRQPADFRRRDRAARRLAIERASDSILSGSGADIAVTHRYRNVPALAGSVSRATLERLARDPNVASIQLDTRGLPMLRESIPASGTAQVHSMFGLTGKGVRVATIDTGIQADHPDLRDAVKVQRCFASDCGTWGADSDTAEDTLGHGTAVAGIIASRGKISPSGFAPEAELVAVKVLSSDSGFGLVSDWVAGLEWIDENLDTLRVDIVNVSLGTEPLYETIEECDRAQSSFANAIDNLIEKGVIVVGAVGNSGSTTSVASPACNRGVIAAGAAYDAAVGMQPSDAPNYFSLSSSFAACADAQTSAGQIACFTNVGPRLDVVVPSIPIDTSHLDSSSKTFRGSSAAAAAVSGIAALARQCNPELSAAELREAIVTTGSPRLDPNSRRSIPVVRAFELIRTLCPELRDEPPSPDAGVSVGSAPSPAGSGAGVPAGPPAGERSARLLGERYTGKAPAPPFDDQSAGDSAADEVNRSGEPEATDQSESSLKSKASESAPNSDGSEEAYSCRTAGNGRDDPWLPGFVLLALGYLARRRRGEKIT